MIYEFVVHSLDPGVPAALSQEFCPDSGKRLEGSCGVDVDGGRRDESVAWSRVRYLDYSFLRVDVAPAPKGRLATLTVRGIAETGDRIDHFTVARRAK